MMQRASQSEWVEASHPKLPLAGRVQRRFVPVLRRFAESLENGEEIGASFAAYHKGELVIDLWGGWADRELRQPWREDSLIVVFSCTKGISSVGLLHLHEQGRLDYAAPVAQYWPGFAKAGKAEITVQQLIEHVGGLSAIDTALANKDYLDPHARSRIVAAMENQAPQWKPGANQGYHALTWGMYVDELFRRITGEDIGSYLRREIFEPLGTDIHLGVPPEVDERIAKLYPMANGERAKHMIPHIVFNHGTEGRVGREVLRKESYARKAFLNPKTDPSLGFHEYNTIPLRRAVLPWAGAVANARSLARLYAPLSMYGELEGKRYFKRESIAMLEDRGFWAADGDLVLQKPIGWRFGFVKEEPIIFSPNTESFCHPGIGGPLGLADPKAGLSIGYAMNRMDYRIRSARCIRLCQTLYRCL